MKLLNKVKKLLKKLLRSNKMEISSKDIKYNKIWLTKDKYIFRSSLGNHWFLKKFIVLYKYLLVDRKKITSQVVGEIGNLFTSFINSIQDPVAKSEAEKFFFKPADFRQPNSLIDFEKFNNVPKLDDAARKYYLVYLMKIGMQSGIKKGIGELLYSDNSITISKIIKEIPKIKAREIQKKKDEGKDPRSVNDSVETIFSDFHAEIRNYRQLLSYRGILPPEEDGYELNEVAKLICVADSKLIMSVWEHQKMKLRYSNPYTRVTRSEDPENKFNTKDDFADFSVNPYLALISVLHDLYLNGGEEGYLSFEDYKYFICREAPFKKDISVNKILEFRSLNESQKEEIRRVFDARPKTREFSMDRKKASSEDFLKELSNFIYGIYEYNFTKNKTHYNNMLKYSNKQVLINNPIMFDNFAVFTEKINEILNDKYTDTYERISNYNSLKLIDEISSDEKLKQHYQQTLVQIREQYLNKYGDDLNDFYEVTLNIWKNYISFIDYELLLMCHAIIVYLDNSEKIRAEELTKEDLFISKELINIVGLKEEVVESCLISLISIINGEKSIKDIEAVMKNISEQEGVVDREDVEMWLDQQLKNNSYSVIKQKLQKEENDLQYTFQSGHRERKRNTAMMLLVQKERINKQLIMGESLPEYKVDNCDVCEAKFSKGEPECHHIIPFEIFGPDINYNYAFLCKECHKFFTHKTLSKQKKEAILRLKIKGIFKREHIEKMIDEGLVQKMHIDFLHKEGFIHIVDKIELFKLIDATKVNYDELDNFFKKTLPSSKRWNRAMKLVFWYRTKYGLIMEKIRLDIPRNKCDTCDKKFGNNEPECHHIIPKRIKGPESPFNYSYLCIECHKSFTHNFDNKEDLIKELKNKNLINKESILEMISNREISKEHLVFLKDEHFINEALYSEFIELVDGIHG